MKLKECKIGVLVSNKQGHIGHIACLSRNSAQEIVPVVIFAGGLDNLHGERRAIHHKNLELFKGE